MALRRTNFSKDKRIVRLLFETENTKHTDIGLKFSKYLDGSLAEHERNVEERLSTLQSNINFDYY